MVSRSVSTNTTCHSQHVKREHARTCTTRVAPRINRVASWQRPPPTTKTSDIQWDQTECHKNPTCPKHLPKVRSKPLIETSGYTNLGGRRSASRNSTRPSVGAEIAARSRAAWPCFVSTLSGSRSAAFDIAGRPRRPCLCRFLTSNHGAGRLHRALPQAAGPPV